MRIGITYLIIFFSFYNLSAQLPNKFKGSRYSKQLPVTVTKRVTHKKSGNWPEKIYKTDDTFWTIVKYNSTGINEIKKNNPEGVLHYDYFIKSMNKDLLENDMQKIITNDYGNNVYLWDFVKVKDKVLAVFLTRDIENQKKIIKASFLNTKTFKIEQVPKTLFEVDWDYSDTTSFRRLYIESKSHSNNHLVFSIRTPNKNGQTNQEKFAENKNNRIPSYWIYNDNLEEVNRLYRSKSERSIDNYMEYDNQILTDGYNYSVYVEKSIVGNSFNLFYKKEITQNVVSFLIIKESLNGELDTLKSYANDLFLDAKILRKSNGDYMVIALEAVKIGNNLFAKNITTFGIDKDNFTLTERVTIPFTEKLLNSVNNLRDPILYSLELNKRRKGQAINDEEKNVLSNVNRFKYVGLNDRDEISIICEEFYFGSSYSSTIQDGVVIHINKGLQFNYEDIIICKIVDKKVTFDYIKKSESIEENVKHIDMSPMHLSNGDLQLQVMHTVIRVPSNGGKFELISLPVEYDISNGKKVKRYEIENKLFIAENEIISRYRRLKQDAWVRTVIQD